MRGCGQGLRPSGWPLVKRGLGWEPGGQPRPGAFLRAPLQLWGSEKGARGYPSLEPKGVSSGDWLGSVAHAPASLSASVSLLEARRVKH